MNGWLKWLPWSTRPVFNPGPKPAPRVLPPAEPRPHLVSGELFECDCGRAHPGGWVCAASIGGRL